MLMESTSAVVARNVVWTGSAATEPYEAGWAREAIVFVRALKTPLGELPEAQVEISPDGMRWADEGTRFPLPKRQDEVTFGRVRHFGNWLRVTAKLPPNAQITVLVTIHLKS
jgi:hypothetical protein